MRIIKKRSLTEYNEKIRQNQYYRDCLYYSRLPIIYQLSDSIDTIDTFYRITRIIHEKLICSMSIIFYRFEDTTIRDKNLQIWIDGSYNIWKLPTILSQIQSKNHWILNNYAKYFLPEICKDCKIKTTDKGIIRDIILQVSFDIIQTIKLLFSTFHFDSRILELISKFIN